MSKKEITLQGGKTISKKFIIEETKKFSSLNPKTIFSEMTLKELEMEKEKIEVEIDNVSNEHYYLRFNQTNYENTIYDLEENLQSNLYNYRKLTDEKRKEIKQELLRLKKQMMFINKWDHITFSELHGLKNRRHTLRKELGKRLLDKRVRKSH
jgi:uncharacterized protein (DUF3084 family)